MIQGRLQKMVKTGKEEVQNILTIANNSDNSEHSDNSIHHGTRTRAFLRSLHDATSKKLELRCGRCGCATSNFQNILIGARATITALRQLPKILSVLKNSFKKSLDNFPKFGYNIIVKRKKEDRFPETFSEKEESK